MPTKINAYVSNIIRGNAGDEAQGEERDIILPLSQHAQSTMAERRDGEGSPIKYERPPPKGG